MDEKTAQCIKSINAQNANERLLAALESLRLAKPEGRGELSRRYAVTITEFEKVVAYFQVYVINANFLD